MDKVSTVKIESGEKRVVTFHCYQDCKPTHQSVRQQSQTYHPTPLSSPALPSCWRWRPWRPGGGCSSLPRGGIAESPQSTCQSWRLWCRSEKFWSQNRPQPLRADRISSELWQNTRGWRSWTWTKIPAWKLDVTLLCRRAKSAKVDPFVNNHEESSELWASQVISSHIICFLSRAEEK